MNFASYGSILFLVVTVILYYTCFRRLQWQLLLFAGIVFYYFSGWSNLLYISATIVTVYITGRLIQRIPRNNAGRPKRKRLLIGCLTLNFSILAVVKYADFAISNVNAITGAGFDLPNFVLPMAISFYTFQSMGYIIDVYRGKEAERNFFRFALFASFFPQLVQGPISRHSDLAENLYGPHKFDINNFSKGVNRIFWGFFKKLVIADRLIPVILELTGGGMTIAPVPGVEAAEGAMYTGAYVLMAVFLYAIVIYSDFSGGIDITIGIAKTLGITVKENFDRPFYSRTCAEYWRRWHITMGTWFRDYLFYPLSSSKPMFKFSKFTRRVCGDYLGKRLPIYVNTTILWFMTGLWHGAAWNFIMWGLANGFAIIIEQELTNLVGKFKNSHTNTQKETGHRPLYVAWSIFRTFWIMSFIRAFDIYPSVGATFRALGSIVINPGFTRFSLDTPGLSLPSFSALAFSVLVLVFTGVISRRMKKEATPFMRAVACVGLAFAIIIFGAYGYGYDATQFIYGQF